MNYDAAGVADVRPLRDDAENQDRLAGRDRPDASLDRFVLRGRYGFASLRSRGCAILSGPGHHDGHSVCAGRQHLDCRPRDRRQDERTPRPNHRRRQQAGRGGNGWHPGGRAKRTGRLHHPARLYRDARDRPVALQKPRLRSAQGFCADRDDRRRAQFPGRASLVAGQNRPRTDCLCEGASGRRQFWIRWRGHRQPYLGRIFRS